MNRKFILTAILLTVIVLILLLIRYKISNDKYDIKIIYDEPVKSYSDESNEISYDMIIDMMSIPESKSADTLYLSGMIPHHKCSIKLAELYIKYNTDNTKLKNLATRIIKEQKKEIELMNKLIGEEEIKDENKALHYINDYNNAMVTSYSHDDIYQTIDEIFCSTMTEYNQMAIDVSKIILKYGSNSETRTLAENIINQLTSKNSELDKL